MYMGTPKSLLQAIKNGLLLGKTVKVDEDIKAHVRDFLAQKFSTSSVLAKNEDELKLIQDLWFEITGEKL